MAYQGGTNSNPGSGWVGSDPRMLQPRHSAPSPSLVNHNHIQGHNQRQYWQHNAQIPYATNPGYANNGYPPQPPPPPPAQNFQPQYHSQSLPQPQQVQHAALQPHYVVSPQYISPAQLLSAQPQPQPGMGQQYPSTVEPIIGRTLDPVNSSTSRMSPSSSNPEQDTVKLLVALAEEYFGAAHEIASSVAASMTEANVGAYEKLIATGLGCLDTALKNFRLPPRLEANIRLRYAGVLYEETENSPEAETALSKGIALCERNHYDDLKYAMQYLLAQSMGKKNLKASVKALTQHGEDAHTYSHFSWVYVFRFLTATHSIKSGALIDYHCAINSLRAAAILAEKQGDHAIFLTASLLEAITYMKTTGPEATENVQRAIAAAWKYQEEPRCKIPQLTGLTHILAVCCSIRQGVSQDMVEKLKAMQSMMDESLKTARDWSTIDDAISIPIRRTPKSSHVVSRDTRMVLGIGADGGDNLMMCFLNKKDTYCVTYLLSGLVLLHKNSSDQKGFKYLKAGLDMLEDTRMPKKHHGSLPELFANRQWRGLLLCYFRVYMAFSSAGAGDWLDVKRYLDELETTTLKFGIPLEGTLDHFVVYLSGVYYQGIGELDLALKRFQHRRFDLSATKNSNATLTDQMLRDLSILAALNELWILQDLPRRDISQNMSLMDKLKPLCQNHPNIDVQTAFNLIAATVRRNPPTQTFEIKNYLRLALSGAKITANTQFLCITLNVMCSRFFSNVVGDQAEKSAMAASTQATNSGNVLWKSVADGMLARCFQLQGKTELAEHTLLEAQSNAQKALRGSSSSKAA
ncbi:hypothetical protein LZ554_003657 [Drepanopeziza brunnea f. sp. 'monogermtubi']|nr:hypothetical protein LZ554_003657 [Drepanopeziza brunnea f. sp. 'monogermtubi']